MTTEIGHSRSFFFESLEVEDSDHRNDSVLRAQRVADYLYLVRSIALRVHATVPRHIELSSLIYAGMQGLNDAASRFDPSKEVVFPSYAKHRIQGSILDGLRQANPVPYNMGNQLTTTPLTLAASVTTIFTGSEITAR